MQRTRPPTHRVLACRSTAWHYLMAFIEIKANSSGQCRCHLSCDLLWGISLVARCRAATTMMKRTRLLAFVLFACWSTCCGTPSCWTRPCQKLEVVKLGWPVKVMVHCEMSASSPVPIRVTSSLQQRCSAGLEALDTHLPKSKWYLLYSSEIIEPWCVWVLDTYQYRSITHGWITLCELWLSRNQYDGAALCIQIPADSRASAATPLF